MRILAAALCIALLVSHGELAACIWNAADVLFFFLQLMHKLEGRWQLMLVFGVTLRRCAVGRSSPVKLVQRTAVHSHN